MKHFRLFLLVFLFISTKISCDSIVLDGTITRMSVCPDIYSVRFNSEYSIQYVPEINLQNYHAFEIIVKIDDGIFDKYCILIVQNEITVLKSFLTGRAALQSVYVNYDSLLWTRDEISELLVRFPKIKKALDIQIKSILKTFPKEYGYIHDSISFIIKDIKSFDNNTYFIFTFSDGHGEFGGVLYVLNSAGEITVEKMLADDIPKPSLHEAIVLSSDKLLLFHLVWCSGWDTRISIENITDVYQ